MGTIRLSDDFVSPAISKANPKITINQKAHQQITAEIERYWDKETYNSTFTLVPVNLKNKLHLYVHSTDAGYAHGQLSWTPNTFENGGEITSDLTVNVTDAPSIPVSIPSGYQDYYVIQDSFGGNYGAKFYEDTNYDNYVMAGSELRGNIIVFDLTRFLSSKTWDHLYLSNTFKDCVNMTSLDISDWDTKEVLSMGGMFSGCKNMVNLNLGTLNTSSCNSLSSMFQQCWALSSLDVNYFDTSNVTNFGGVFDECKALTSLNITNWNTSKATSIREIVKNCISLTSLDLSNLNTNNVTDMYMAFSYCDNLEVLDLSNLNTENVTQMSLMFNGSNKLKYLIIGSSTFKFQLKSGISLPSTCKILVPSALISTYQNATNWSVHASKFDAIENYDIVRSNGQVTVTPKNA